MKFEEVGKETKALEMGQEIALPGLYNMETIKKDFLPYHQEIDKILKDAEEVVVKDEHSLKSAVTIGGGAKKLNKKITAQRKEIVEDPNQFVKSVNNFCKTFTDKLLQIENTVKKKIADYQYSQELQRREQERKAQEAAMRLQDQLDKEAEEKNVAPVQVVTPVIPKQPAVARSESGASSHIRMQWVGEIEDEPMIPIEYCSPDQKKINNAIKMGIRQIAGVRIWEKPTSILRT